VPNCLHLYIIFNLKLTTMKFFFQCFLLFALCLSSIESMAQDGLKFSKTFIIEVPKDGHAFTVPEGKIWRIEAAGGLGVGGIWLKNQSSEKMFLCYSGINASFLQNPFNLSSHFAGHFILEGTAKDPKGFVSITEYTITP